MKTIEVVAAIIRSNDKIFATQRGYGEFKGMWEFPGGKMEQGESPEQALVREIHEELAATIKPEKFVCTVDYDYPEFHLTMHNFLCSIEEGSLILLEHSDSKWVDASDIDSLDWLPADVKVVEALKADEIV